MADTSRSVYTVHRRLDVLESNVNEALQSAKSAHARLDVAPKVGPAGERGLKGDAGRDAVSIPGKDGKDGVGYPGSHGVNGQNGRDGAPGQDTAAVLASARAEISDLKAKFAALSSDFNVLSLAFTSQSKKSSDYYQWLLARAADRIAKNDALIAARGKQ
jgi:hypothetical protein